MQVIASKRKSTATYGALNSFIFAQHFGWHLQKRKLFFFFLKTSEESVGGCFSTKDSVNRVGSFSQLQLLPYFDLRHI